MLHKLNELKQVGINKLLNYSFDLYFEEIIGVVSN